MHPTKKSFEEIAGFLQKELSLSDFSFLAGKSYSGVSVSVLPWILAASLEQIRKNKRILFVFSNDKTAENFYLELSLILSELLPSVRPEFFPSFGNLPFNYSHAQSEKEGYRARTLAALVEGRGSIVVTSLEGLTQKTVSSALFRESSLRLSVGDRLDIETIVSYLVRFGYARTEIAEKPGDFSRKGSLLDMYLPSLFNPVRLDFFGDEIDSIRHFDPLSQKSLESLDNVLLTPRRDLAFSGEDFEKLQNEIAAQSRPGQELPPLIHGNDPGGMWDLFPLALPAGSLLDYVGDSLFVLYDPGSVAARGDSLNGEREFLYEKNNSRFLLPPDALFLDAEKMVERLNPRLTFSPVPVTLDDINLSLRQPTAHRGRISMLADSLLANASKKKDIFISAATSMQLERIEHILSSYDLSVLNIRYLLSSFHSGFEWKTGLFLTERELFGKQVRAGKISRSTTQIIESFVDLNEGDLVVHVNYGIGKFIRLKRMQAAGTERDFLELAFAGGDKLYVPLEQLNLVHRYIGSAETRHLDYLGKKSSWQKTKEKAVKSVDSLAEELIEIYARREKSRGYSFPADSSFQEEFEAAFPYEETDHQIAAVNDIKKDMESERPMDRLVCGDVGFGKTEVAVRAAFKAVMAGKQVAVLCPTTILAFQHFNTLQERFKGYPISVDYVSRFRTGAEVTAISHRIEQGKLDVVIGTHALFSPSFKFKNLGLLVVDEEQRFGVSHKETIRKMRANIDTLTMTATPIPRTLHMSLVGIRDLSLIETPPRNRQKIETYVLEENNEVLRQAINREYDRQGQIYILHNEVKTIEAQAGRIRSMNPRLSVGILHGQMGEEEIENIMLDFHHHRFDVLVSTTIIESGIDIPNVNTLIVMNSQKFGLSQLYQIKGRVGRSDRQAYAYFFYPSAGSLTEVAQKRLNTLQDYDELGAGFKIAMRDLEIRGAGNLLGREQSGEILDVGFELYVQMLNERIDTLRGTEKTEEQETLVTSPFSFYFPDGYIPDTRQKMEFYKKMVSSHSSEDLRRVREELEDRFGELPEMVQGMFFLEEIRSMGSRIGLEKIDIRDTSVQLIAGPKVKVSGDSLGELLNSDKRFALSPENPRAIEFRPRGKDFAALRELAAILSYF